MGINENPDDKQIDANVAVAPKSSAAIANETREQISLTSHIERLLTQIPKQEQTFEKSEIKVLTSLSEEETSTVVNQALALKMKKSTNPEEAVTLTEKETLLAIKKAINFRNNEAAKNKSEIKEVRTFSEQEILEAVVRTCALQGLDLGKLEKTRIIRDSQNTIVVLEVMTPDIDNNGGYSEFKYVIRGRHDMNLNPDLTKIDHAHYDQDQIPDGGLGEAARFADGKWLLGVHVNIGGKEVRATCEMKDGKFIFSDTETNEKFEITVVDGKQVVTPINA